MTAEFQTGLDAYNEQMVFACLREIELGKSYFELVNLFPEKLVSLLFRIRQYILKSEATEK